MDRLDQPPAWCDRLAALFLLPATQAYRNHACLQACTPRLDRHGAFPDRQHFVLTAAVLGRRLVSVGVIQNTRPVYTRISRLDILRLLRSTTRSASFPVSHLQ